MSSNFLQNLKKKWKVYVTKYIRINSTKYSATGASKDREPRLMSQVGREREFVYA